MGIKFCAQQTITSEGETKKKERERRWRIMRYENFDLDSGARQTQKVSKGERGIEL
jgi:hypothetical protein